MGDYFRDFLATPYRGDMTAIHWVFFIGLLMIAVVAWRFVLTHLRGVPAAITS